MGKNFSFLHEKNLLESLYLRIFLMSDYLLRARNMFCLFKQFSIPTPPFDSTREILILDLYPQNNTHVWSVSGLHLITKWSSVNHKSKELKFSYIVLMDILSHWDRDIASSFVSCEGPFTKCVFFWLRLRFGLSQQMGCTGLNGSVHTMWLRQHH